MPSSKKVRITIQTQLVLHALLEDPVRELYGLEICEAANLPSGTVHPILARLENLGWLLSRWEEVDPQVSGRPRRRYYKLSPNGADQAARALAEARTPVTRRPGNRPLLIEGDL